MKVCRYDQGNTTLFTCPYHAWSYATDGKLVGVPLYEQIYAGIMDKASAPLIEVAQMVDYKGTIWATWDPQARRSKRTWAARSTISTGARFTRRPPRRLRSADGIQSGRSVELEVSAEIFRAIATTTSATAPPTMSGSVRARVPV